MNGTHCRSALYMPASNARALAKGPTLEADAIIVDLEDSVAPEAKASARDAAVRALTERDYGHRLRALRVNAADTPWHVEDVRAAIAAAPDVVVLPKVESPESVLALLAALGGAAGRAPRLWAMLETPTAVLRAADIAALGRRDAAVEGEGATGVSGTAGSASRDSAEPRARSRLDALLVGNNDLARAAGLPVAGSREHLKPWLMSFVAAAKAHGLAILDGVWNDIADTAGLARECAEGRAMGMDGKTLIHPAQLETANRAWTPNADEITEARAVVAAFDAPEAAGRGALRVDGRMVERLHLDIARRTLALAERLRERSDGSDGSDGDGGDPERRR